MTLDAQANEDFSRALRKAFWRKVSTWLKREENQLVPYHEIRSRLPIKGQSSLGLKTVPLNQIIGSAGRYRDFDRAFLPLQDKTKDRWLNIDRAHLEQINLPPIQLYKIGEAYFVRDGNHRVSVAIEQGMTEIEAEVIELRVPVPISADTRISDLDLKEEYARFLEHTGLQTKFPEIEIEFTIPGEYDRLYEHIHAHRWYLGERRDSPVTFEDAAASWYQTVYMPLSDKIIELELLDDFPHRKVADLYLWISEYQWYRRGAFSKDSSTDEASTTFIEDHDYWPAKKVVRVLRDAAWLDWMTLNTEKEAFEDQTNILAYRPEARIEPTLPGKFEIILNHIDDHRWFLGHDKGEEIAYPDAVISWYDNVYMPLVEEFRSENFLQNFPGRTETDLYLWVLANREFLTDES